MNAQSDDSECNKGRVHLQPSGGDLSIDFLCPIPYMWQLLLSLYTLLIAVTTFAILIYVHTCICRYEYSLHLWDTQKATLIHTKPCINAYINSLVHKIGI